jgi:hypothetical protein
LVWAFLAVAVIGFATGLRFRVSMLFGVTVVVVALTVAAAGHFGWTIARFIIVCFALLIVQQICYFLGLCVSWMLDKRRRH